MKLLKKTKFGMRYLHWTCIEAIAYFLKGVTRELKIAPSFFLNLYHRIADFYFKKKWLKRINSDSCFDFNGCKVPDISYSQEKLRTLRIVFNDVLIIPVFYNDNYEKTFVDFLDAFLDEGPYGYVHDSFNVTVKKDDIVIDAGAWIGDFSAYAASKGGIVYAFEPVLETYQLLCQTVKLNDGIIYPVQKGLSSSIGELQISINNENSGANSILVEESTNEIISITTIDQFVEENKINKVDFIKADIEGTERYMLEGASAVLSKFAPKLAICTYHLPDDPVVLEGIILKANPKYKIIHLRHKLFAAVIK